MENSDENEKEKASTPNKISTPIGNSVADTQDTETAEDTGTKDALRTKLINNIERIVNNLSKKENPDPITLQNLYTAVYNWFESSAEEDTQIKNLPQILSFLNHLKEPLGSIDPNTLIKITHNAIDSLVGDNMTISELSPAELIVLKKIRSLTTIRKEIANFIKSLIEINQALLATQKNLEEEKGSYKDKSRKLKRTKKACTALLETDNRALIREKRELVKRNKELTPSTLEKVLQTPEKVGEYVFLAIIAILLSMIGFQVMEAGATVSRQLRTIDNVRKDNREKERIQQLLFGIIRTLQDAPAQSAEGVELSNHLAGNLFTSSFDLVRLVAGGNVFNTYTSLFGLRDCAQLVVASKINYENSQIDKQDFLREADRLVMAYLNLFQAEAAFRLSQSELDKRMKLANSIISDFDQDDEQPLQTPAKLKQFRSAGEQFQNYSFMENIKSLQTLIYDIKRFLIYRTHLETYRDNRKNFGCILRRYGDTPPEEETDVPTEDELLKSLEKIPEDIWSSISPNSLPTQFTTGNGKKRTSAKDFMRELITGGTDPRGGVITSDIYSLIDTESSVPAIISRLRIELDQCLPNNISEKIRTLADTLTRLNPQEREQLKNSQEISKSLKEFETKLWKQIQEYIAGNDELGKALGRLYAKENIDPRKIKLLRAMEGVDNAFLTNDYTKKPSD